MAVQPMPKLKEQPLKYASTREKAVTCNTVVLSDDHFLFVLSPSSLHLWSTLPPVSFPTARHILYYTTLCRIHTAAKGL